MKKMSKSAQRIFILIAISVVSIAGILYFTVDERTGPALGNIKPMFLFALFGVWLAMLVADAGAISLFTRATGEHIGMFAALKTTTVRMFFNIITPFSFGGQPFSVVSLKQQGIPSGKGSSIVIIKLMTLSIFTQAGALLAFIFFHNQISTVKALNGIFMVSGLTGAGFILLLTFGFLYPQALVKSITTIGRLLHAMHLVKDVRRLKRKVIMQTCDARRSYRKYFSHHLWLFISGFICNGATYMSQLVLLWLILRGLGLEVPFVTGIVLAAMLLFLITFMPTPGAIGLGEAIFLILFAGTVPTYLLGIALILWRFFYHYLSAILGAISSSEFMSDLLIKKEG